MVPTIFMFVSEGGTPVSLNTNFNLQMAAFQITYESVNVLGTGQYFVSTTGTYVQWTMVAVTVG